MLQVHLTRMCILLLSDKMFCKYRWGPFGSYCCSDVLFPHWFCLDALFIVESGVLKSPTRTVLLFISPCNSLRFCFMYLGEILLTHSYAIIPFIADNKLKNSSSWTLFMLCLYKHMATIFTIFSLMLILSDIVTPAVFCYHFLKITFSTPSLFQDKISLLLATCHCILFFIHSAILFILCLLIGELNLLMFKVILIRAYYHNCINSLVAPFKKHTSLCVLMSYCISMLWLLYDVPLCNY